MPTKSSHWDMDHFIIVIPTTTLETFSSLTHPFHAYHIYPGSHKDEYTLAVPKLEA